MTSIQTLSLRSHVLGALVRAGVETVEQLAEMSEDEILELPRIGPTGMVAIKAELVKLGLELPPHKGPQRLLRRPIGCWELGLSTRVARCLRRFVGDGEYEFKGLTVGELLEYSEEQLRVLRRRGKLRKMSEGWERESVPALTEEMISEIKDRLAAFGLKLSESPRP